MAMCVDCHQSTMLWYEADADILPTCGDRFDERVNEQRKGKCEKRTQ